MSKLEQVRAIAQRDANANKRPFAILNLNRFSPLYVVREVPPTAQHEYLRKTGELVEIVEPNT
jgi:hypothetical protein